MSALSARPHPVSHWEKRVLAAYLRMCGMSQKDAGAAILRSVRTLRRWEADQPIWTRARQEAARRWLDDVTDAARKTVLDAVRAGDAEIGFKILERRVPELAPPKTRVEINIPWDSLSDDALRRLAAGEDPAKVLTSWHRNGSTPAPE